MNRDNIVLIGMPGVGKSTVGVVLAKALGYQFVDADLLIQEAEGKLLSELIEEHGTDGFIEIENRVNSQIQTHRSVIATGGSVVYGKEAMEHLKSIGTVVYLKQNLRVLQRRLRNLKGRGVVLKEGQTLVDLYKERTVLYEKYADITVDQYKQSIEQTLKAVRKALEEN
ncbi:MAG: shikimate kinase [Lachnospiraceae bacterium]|jgi:shikimate kinase|uniref:shikimate kinase n=1 Tax=Eubacterium ramulus TaxID=39490 RepID=UPI001D220D2B|nr:shikimate kinase [Eubacterium ramulus]MBS5190254.1 shikimate kinase [Lachnospiraceae bacterium]